MMHVPYVCLSLKFRAGGVSFVVELGFVTRAKSNVVIYGAEDAVRVGCETGRVRASGLLGRLWG